VTTWSRWTPPRLTSVLARTPSSSGYDAFISCSHAGDARVAAILQRSSHGFARSWYRLRALRVFRDTASLSADASLWAAIQRALASTRFLILVASSEAAGSKWVAKEVDWWCSHKSKEHLLIVVSEGIATWSETANDFDWDNTTAAPRVPRACSRRSPSGSTSDSRRVLARLTRKGVFTSERCPPMLDLEPPPEERPPWMASRFAAAAMTSPSRRDVRGDSRS